MRVRLILIVAGLLVTTNLVFAAEEELFDTKAASLYVEQGLDHIRTKHLGDAVKALEEAVAIAPDAEAYYYLGYAYYLKGRTTGDNESRKKSIENFEKAYDLDPSFTPAKLKQEPSVPQADQKSPEQDLPQSAPKRMLDAQPAKIVETSSGKTE